MKSFAIVVIGYNRLKQIKRLVESLEKVNFEGRKDITLIFSIDKSSTNEVEDFCMNYKWEFGDKKTRTFETNQGLRNHVLKCGDYTQFYDVLVILEDDLFVSDSMYSFAYKSALYYENDDNVAGISLYNFQKNWLDWNLRFEPFKDKYDNYFIRVAQSWGQVWTESKWKLFKEWYIENLDFVQDDEIPDVLMKWPESSWLKYHTKYCIVNNKYFVYPHFSLTSNFSDPGTHSSITESDYQTEFQWGKTEYAFAPFIESKSIYDEFLNNTAILNSVYYNKIEVCYDLWQTQTYHNIIKKKYLLTTKRLELKLIKSYGLNLRPIELNVLMDIPGEGIYLYENSKVSKFEMRTNKKELYKYSIRNSNTKTLIIPVLLIFYDKLISKFSKAFKRTAGKN